MCSGRYDKALNVAYDEMERLYGVFELEWNATIVTRDNLTTLDNLAGLLNSMRIYIRSKRPD